MPYIMVMGSLSAPHLSKDDGATVYGLKSEERAALVRELNSSFGMAVATASELERTVRVTQKGLTLVLVNRIHGLLGYDVVSHAMAMTNANRELISFTMYKKSSANSHGQTHGQTHSHGQAHNHGQPHSQSHSHGQTHSQSHSHGQTHSQSHSHGQTHSHGHTSSHKSHTHGSVVTL